MRSIVIVLKFGLFVVFDWELDGVIFIWIILDIYGAFMAIIGWIFIHNYI
jgi:hypothetical protein